MRGPVYSTVRQIARLPCNAMPIELIHTLMSLAFLAVYVLATEILIQVRREG